jgi:hypothetical protein
LLLVRVVAASDVSLPNSVNSVKYYFAISGKLFWELSGMGMFWAKKYPHQAGF